MFSELIRRAAIVLGLLAFGAGSAYAGGDQEPTIKQSVKPNASEAAFVAEMQADLTKRFAKPADAEAAGYFRYTDADDTGAISYANLKWQSTDVHSPSQLWYSKTGQLLGADYSRVVTDTTRPSLWGIQPGRWAELSDHIHWIGTDPKTGAPTYDHYSPAKPFVAAGGVMNAPTAAVLVKMHKVTSESDVKRIFEFPDVWDLTIWVLPNVNGAFADHNPTIG